MRYKLIGGAVILAAAFLLSFVLNEKEKEKLEKIEGLTALLRFFRIQIDCFCTPVGEIFRRCDEKVLFSCGFLGIPRDFDEFLAKTSFPPEADALLASFSAELGTSFREEQLKSCDYHIQKLCELRDSTAEKTKKQIRLNTTLCLTAAATAVILLL